MDTINREWQAAKGAIDRGDWKAAERSLQTMLDKAGYMRKFEGYHNADKRDDFLAEQKLFVQHVQALRDEIAQGDRAVISARVLAVQESCSRCHSKFK